MAGFVERIVQEQRESKERKKAAFAAVISLPPDERREVLAELILHVEAEGETAAPTSAPPPQPRPVAPPTPAPTRETFTDKAEAYVVAHPKGVKTADVARAIGQDVSSVDGSLRLVMKRGRIARSGRLWVPVVQKTNGVALNEQKHERQTIRVFIHRVFASNGNTPLGAAALFEALKLLQPDINRSSVDGEMNRMRKDTLLVQVGVGPNGGGLYKLTEAKARPN